MKKNLPKLSKIFFFLSREEEEDGFSSFRQIGNDHSRQCQKLRLKSVCERERVRVSSFEREIGFVFEREERVKREKKLKMG